MKKLTFILALLLGVMITSCGECSKSSVATVDSVEVITDSVDTVSVDTLAVDSVAVDSIQ